MTTTAASSPSDDVVSAWWRNEAPKHWFAGPPPGMTGQVMVLLPSEMNPVRAAYVLDAYGVTCELVTLLAEASPLRVQEQTAGNASPPSWAEQWMVDEHRCNEPVPFLSACRTFGCHRPATIEQWLSAVNWERWLTAVGSVENMLSCLRAGFGLTEVEALLCAGIFDLESVRVLEALSLP